MQHRGGCLVGRTTSTVRPTHSLEVGIEPTDDNRTPLVEVVQREQLGAQAAADPVLHLAGASPPPEASPPDRASVPPGEPAMSDHEPDPELADEEPEGEYEPLEMEQGLTAEEELLMYQEARAEVLKSVKETGWYWPGEG